MWQLGLLRLAYELDRDLQALSRRAGGARALWELPASRADHVFRGDGEAAQTLRRLQNDFDHVGMPAQLASRGVWCAVPQTDDALAGLLELPDPPFALIGRGTPPAGFPSGPRIALVGSRRPTAAGRSFTTELARGLCERGAIVISGLALGIDAAAHEGALAAGGVTIAVLGSGVQKIAPTTNRGLAERILAMGGSLLSEYWVDTSPAPWRFPARNRLVAGLADAVVVVQAAERSGALITADFALDLGRPVLSVPGLPGSTMSAGCHQLIRAGAALCEGVDDVIAELNDHAWTIPDALAAISPERTSLLQELAREPLELEQLTERLGMAAADVMVSLGQLELDGRVVRDVGGRYRVTGR